jgi:hypothetical protein
VAGDRGVRAEEDAKRFATERMQPAFEEVGASPPPPPELLLVHN